MINRCGPRGHWRAVLRNPVPGPRRPAGLCPRLVRRALLALGQAGRPRQHPGAGGSAPTSAMVVGAERPTPATTSIRRGRRLTVLGWTSSLRAASVLSSSLHIVLPDRRRGTVGEG